jgi:hypothetical protein
MLAVANSSIRQRKARVGRHASCSARNSRFFSIRAKSVRASSACRNVSGYSFDICTLLPSKVAGA